MNGYLIFTIALGGLITQSFQASNDHADIAIANDISSDLGEANHSKQIAKIQEIDNQENNENDTYHDYLKNVSDNECQSETENKENNTDHDDLQAVSDKKSSQLEIDAEAKAYTVSEADEQRRRWMCSNTLCRALNYVGNNRCYACRMNIEEQEQQLKWYCPNTLCKNLNSNGDKCSACRIKKYAEPKAYTLFRIGEADLSSVEDSSSNSDEPEVHPKQWTCITCRRPNYEPDDVCHYRKARRSVVPEVLTRKW
eukprot:657376_1